MRPDTRTWLPEPVPSPGFIYLLLSLLSPDMSPAASRQEVIRRQGSVSPIATHHVLTFIHSVSSMGNIFVSLALFFFFLVFYYQHIFEVVIIRLLWFPNLCPRINTPIVSAASGQVMDTIFLAPDTFLPWGHACTPTVQGPGATVLVFEQNPRSLCHVLFWTD